MIGAAGGEVNKKTTCLAAVGLKNSEAKLKPTGRAAQQQHVPWQQVQISIHGVTLAAGAGGRQMDFSFACLAARRAAVSHDFLKSPPESMFSGL